MATDNEDKSFADKIGDVFSGIGNDLAMGLGMKDKTQDYLDRTAAHQAMSRDDGGDGGSSGLPSLSPEKDMSKIYAENLRRYNEYMEQQKQQPQQPKVTPEMRREALNIFESQQGAGQVPYYMAAARNQYNPNMSPAFRYAAQNYDILGGSQRLGPRPMEMMSVAERRQINDMAQAMADQQTQQQAEQNQYQQGMDMVLRGGGKGGGATMPQQGGQFNSMEELMDFQNKNPHMNLMGEYQRLKSLEGGNQPTQQTQMTRDFMPRIGGKGGGATMPQYPSNYGGMTNPPLPFAYSNQRSPFAAMLASRFGGFGSY